MQPEVMALVERNIGRLATTIAAGFGASAAVTFRTIATPVVNNTAEAIAYGDAAVALVGAANVDTNAPPVMGSEDFAFMMERVPGAHISIGNGATAGVHNHRYDFNDEAIPYGAALYAAIVEKKLPKGRAAVNAAIDRLGRAATVEVRPPWPVLVHAFVGLTTENTENHKVSRRRACWCIMI